MPGTSQAAAASSSALRTGRAWTVCTLALLAAVLWALGSADCAQGYARRVPADFVGVNGQFLRDLSPAKPWSAAAPRLLDEMASGGIELVRVEPAWANVEPNPPDASGHHYSWDYTDGMVGNLAQHHLRLYGLAAYSALWAGAQPGDVKSAPVSIDYFADYARALVARYGPNGSFWQAHPELPYLPVHSWEIWNEENGYFWDPRPDPARYVDLYLAARSAIRSVDPTASVVVGGLIPFGAEGFLRAMLEHRPDARGQIDAVGFHPYAADADSVMQTIVSFRHQLAGLGLPTVPIEITEVGWPTAGGPGAMPDQQRAAQYQRLTDLVARSDCGVTRFMPYTWVGDERSPDTVEDWYGLFHPDGTPTAAGLSYLQAARILEGQGPQPAPLDTVYRCGSPPSAAPRPPTRLRITGYRVSPRVLRTARRAGASGARGSRAFVRFRLSAAASVSFQVQRCVRVRRPRRRPRVCVRYATLAGSFTAPGRQGANAVRIDRRLGHHRLAPGGYRLLARAYRTGSVRPAGAATGFRVSR